jgi:negative regulator of sigma E activity
MGAINVFGSVFQDYQITVVGEVPQPTVEMIAQSIKYQNTAADND